MKREAFTLGQYNDSFNFAFGLAYFKDDGFDILNNPYFDVKPYRISTNEIFDEPYTVDRCTHAELDRFLVKKHWYPNALCFQNRDKVVVNSNWFSSVYEIPTVSLAFCKNSTANNNWCKSREETAKFMDAYPFFFIHQQTYV